MAVLMLPWPPPPRSKAGSGGAKNVSPLLETKKPALSTEHARFDSSTAEIFFFPFSPRLQVLAAAEMGGGRRSRRRAEGAGNGQRKGSQDEKDQGVRGWRQGRRKLEMGAEEGNMDRLNLDFVPP